MTFRVQYQEDVALYCPQVLSLWTIGVPHVYLKSSSSWGLRAMAAV